ncbi:unnamed protein product, partial [Polarella glacialis]
DWLLKDVTPPASDEECEALQPQSPTEPARRLSKDQSIPETSPLARRLSKDQSIPETSPPAGVTKDQISPASRLASPVPGRCVSRRLKGELPMEPADPDTNFGALALLLCVCLGRLEKWNGVISAADKALTAEGALQAVSKEQRRTLHLRRGVAAAQIATTRGHSLPQETDFSNMEADFAKARLCQPLMVQRQVAYRATEHAAFLKDQVKSAAADAQEQPKRLHGLARLRAMEI